MTACEHHQMQLSALIDGEADQRELVETVDHLLTCPKCARFYREARGLQRVAGALAASTGEVIVAAPRHQRFRHRLAWGWAAAAVIVAALGLWVGDTLEASGQGPIAAAGERTLSLRLEEDRGQMSEERFIELTSELLRADRRYHRAMYEVLDQVEPRRTESQTIPM